MLVANLVVVRRQMMAGRLFFFLFTHATMSRLIRATRCCVLPIRDRNSRWTQTTGAVIPLHLLRLMGVRCAGDTVTSCQMQGVGVIVGAVASPAGIRGALLRGGVAEMALRRNSRCGRLVLRVDRDPRGKGCRAAWLSGAQHQIPFAIVTAKATLGPPFLRFIAGAHCVDDCAQGAFSHSARTAPVITVFTPVTALSTCHLPTGGGEWPTFRTARAQRVHSARYAPSDALRPNISDTRSRGRVRVLLLKSRGGSQSTLQCDTCTLPRAKATAQQNTDGVRVTVRQRIQQTRSRGPAVIAHDAAQRLDGLTCV